MMHGPINIRSSSLASQEIHLILWNCKVHYRIHNRPPLVLVLSQINPVHAVPSYIFTIHFHILRFPPRSVAWSLAFRFTDQTSACIWLYSADSSHCTIYKAFAFILFRYLKNIVINPLTPNDPYRGRTTPLSSKRCTLYIFIQQL
jgi:hypothetical protein